MSEFYDNYHRWEPLAEFNFDVNDTENEEFNDDNFLYCLCSRAYIRDCLKTYNVDEKDGSESDMEVLRDSGSQGWEDQSHVHFSLDTSYKVKCEKDEVASCYCSASHTDNCCSTDEHDAHHGISHALQPSDSGADLTYQDCHSEYTNPDKLEQMDQDFPNPSEENYQSEETFDKFWAVNGERLIWASWIKKYSDYINPAYLDENNDLVADDSSIHKQKSVDQIYRETEQTNEDMRERKFSYDSKINPYKKGQNQVQTEKLDKSDNKDEAWLPSRRRSCSEHERIISPRTLPGTDSMTNVTKITLSSYDVTSTHVTSDSSPTDDYSVSSSTSDDQSNDQTRIANLENIEPTSVDDMDTDQYWQLLWKQHFGEQYALHYANYIESFHAQELPGINIEVTSPKEETKVAVETQNSLDKVLDIECENSEGNSQELPTVIEVQTRVEDMKIQEPVAKQRKRGKKKKDSMKYVSSVGVLLHSLRNDEIVCDATNDVEVVEAGEEGGDKKDKEPVTDSCVEGNSIHFQQSMSNTNFTPYSYDDGDDDPPEDTPVNLKRSHEMDDEEVAAEKIKATFEIMGFSVKNNNIPKGQMVYRKRTSRLRPPGYKTTEKYEVPRKTYFDEDGNPIQQSKDSQDEGEMQTYDNYTCPDFKSEAIRILNLLSQETGETSNENVIQETSQVEVDKLCIDLNNTEQIDMSHNTEHMCIDVNDPHLNNVNIKTENETADLTARHSFDIDKESKDINVDTNYSIEDCHTFDSKKSIVEIQQADTKNLAKGSIDTKEMKHDCNSSQVTGTENTAKEAISCIEAVDKFNIDVETFKERDNYDVQNKSENYAKDENSAMEASGMPLPDDLDQSTDETNTDNLDNTVSQSVESVKRRRRRQKRYAKLDEAELSNLPEELRDDPKMMKYWKKRHSLFHRFDEGIRLDRESWFSVTPENVARHIARKYTYDTVLDGFCGAGGNTIQFAFTSKKVIAIDIDPVKIEMARHNASVYGVLDRIEFIVGDFFELAPQLQADMVFLSPPWGGPSYSNNVQYDIETMLEPKPASELMSAARNISTTISLYLPRNSRPDQILSLAMEAGCSVEIEQSYLGKRFVAITAYFY